MSVLKKFSTLAVLLVAVTFAFVERAYAVSIGGEEYTAMLTLKSSFDFGYWPGPNKYFTFISNDNHIKPIPVASVTSRDSKLNGVTFKDVFAMGTTEGEYGPVNSGNVKLLGKNGLELLTANVVPGAKLTSTLKPGFAGQLSVFGEYDTTGGTLASIFGTELYVGIDFDYVWQNKYQDLKTTFGTWTFYSKNGGTSTPPPSNEVPEPATVGMLLTGLAGAKFARRRKAS